MDDIEAIRQLKARYFRLMDTKDWDGFRACFTDDLVVDVSADGAGTFEGVEAFMAMLVPTMREVVSVHHGHMPEISITGDDTATGIWAMEDQLRFGGQAKMELHGYGHYHETYRKVEGEWKIATTRLTRLRLDLTQG